MATESNVAITPDNAATGAHNIRVVVVYPKDPVSTTYGEKQQVVTLAGSDGTMVEVTNGAVPIASAELAMLLRAVIRRLDLLNAVMDRKYSPPDELSR